MPKLKPENHAQYLRTETRSNDYGQDKNDCTVQALTRITGDYDYSRQFLEERGRKRHKGMNTYKFKEALKNIRGYRTIFMYNGWKSKTPLTVWQAAKKYPQGKYIVLVSGHAFNLINGIVYDHQRPKQLARVSEMYLFLPEEVQ